jgi:protein-tyrosine phosphatase
MPMTSWTEKMYRELEGISIKQGLTPIIAHMDRYIRPFRTHGIPERLAEMPVYVQANAGFFLDRATSRMAMRLLRENKIQLLGSDCHNLTSRAPNLDQTIRLIGKKLGQEAIRWIRSNEDQILPAEA